jgi:phosphoribosylformylglycinamidine cyclo-ligase
VPAGTPTLPAPRAVTDQKPASYAGAGVDIEAGDKAVGLIRDAVRSTYRPEVVGDIGGFGGMFALRAADYDQPVLVSSTDGVGTKAMVAAAARRYGTIGIDLVAMCVDDIVCQGAEPLFLLDYLAVGKLDPETAAEIVEGVAEGCRRAGCALLGGEMAEHPGTMAPGEFDLSGFAVGVVERSEVLGRDRVRPGNKLVGLVSPGLRCNGYSLARQVLGDEPALTDVVLEPSVVYAPAVLAVKRVLGPGLHAAAHITGGGLVGNVPRALPDDADAVLDGRTWEVPEVFGRIRRAGGVDVGEMTRVFNLGLGMVLAVAPGSEERAVEVLEGAGCPAAVVGEVVAGSGDVRIEGLAL